MRISWPVLLTALVLSVPCCRQGPPEPSNGQKASAQFDDPNELAQAFMDALFKDPQSAYSLCEASYRNSVSEEQFRSGLKTMLPPPDTITSVTLLTFEDEFQESDGKMSCSSSYQVLSSDDFQAKSKVEVDIVKSGDTYRVRRFSVSAISE